MATIMDDTEMLKALYDFQAVYPKTISFDEGEYFILYQTSARQRNWWQVVSMKGNIGFVPSNYVMKIKVEPDFLISFLNSSIETLEKSKETEINGIMPKEELLVRLKEKKISMERMYSDNTERDADSSFSFSHSMSERNSSKQFSLSRAKDYGSHSPPPSNGLQHCKKSISSPSMGTMVPHLLQESASLESLPGSQQQPLVQPSIQQTQTQTQNTNQSNQTQPSQPQSKVNDITQDSSITSEPSTTTTTTSEEVVTTYREPSLKETPSSTTTYSHSRDNNSNNNQTDGGGGAGVGLHMEMNGKFVDSSLQLMTTDKDAVQDEKLADEKSESSEAVADDAQSNEKAVVIISMEDNLGLDSTGHTSVMSHSSYKTSSSHSVNYKGLNRKVESSDVYQIVDAIRRHTNMSFEISCEALRVVLTSMEQLYSGDINPYLEAIAVHVTEKVETPKELLGMTHDAKRLQYIFSQLADCKNDSQQRSWMVYEDEDDIVQFIEELVEILNNADESICCYEMSCDQYQAMVNLIQYYQMETRWPIKRLLLKAFTAACHLDAIIVDILITSVLPLEIVEDIKVQFTTLERLKDLIKMLTIIFSLGQPMPINHQDYLGLQFAEFLLETIENHNSENFIDMLITLVLAFNLQFSEVQQNPIIEAMQSVATVKTFTEKILLLLNREEEDPVRVLKHNSNAMNSVLKIFIDIFSVKEAAVLFYTTDNKVLIDIVVRQLSDLCAGNPLRRCYLELCRRILRNTNYAEHQHRKQDFMKIFTRIFCEDTEQSASDQQLVRDIANEFSQIFKA